MEKDPKTNIFSEETLESLVDLGKILRKIRNRLISEDYEIKDGQITKNR